MIEQNAIKKVTLVLPIDDSGILAKALDNESISYKVEGISELGFEALGFDIESINSVIIAIGSSGIVATLAKVLISYLSERKKELSIRLEDGNFELTSTNLNSKEIERILQNLHPKETIWIIERLEEKTSIIDLSPTEFDNSEESSNCEIVQVEDDAYDSSEIS